MIIKACHYWPAFKVMILFYFYFSGLLNKGIIKISSLETGASLPRAIPFGVQSVQRRFKSICTWNFAVSPKNLRFFWLFKERPAKTPTRLCGCALWCEFLLGHIHMYTFRRRLAPVVSALFFCNSLSLPVAVANFLFYPMKRKEKKIEKIDYFWRYGPFSCIYTGSPLNIKTLWPVYDS